MQNALRVVIFASITFFSFAAFASLDQRALQKLQIDRSDALSDPYNRVGLDFKVPKVFKKRVGFWFDIYTKYDSSKHVIHHSRFPWIVFKVVDTSKVLNGPGNHWAKYHKAEKLVRIEKKKIRNALKRLSKRKSFRKLSGLEKKLYKTLYRVRGKRKNVFRFASKSVRSQLGQKNFFMNALENSGKYMSHMEEEFKRQKLPIELTRIPFVESSFNERARSKVGASGIWQIMPKTGRAFGIVGRFIDERNSPLKATVMAAKVLKQNHRSLKKWPLSVTAYNHGIGFLRKSIRRAGTSDLATLVSRYRGGAFKFASSNFYASFLAALHAERYQREIFKKTYFIEPPIKFEVVKISRPMRIHKFLRLANIDRKTFLNLNLDVKNAMNKNSRLPRGLKIFVPPGKSALIIRKLAVMDAIHAVGSDSRDRRAEAKSDRKTL